MSKDLGITFKGCEVRIDKMFDIHDNDNVHIHVTEKQDNPTDDSIYSSCCFSFAEQEYLAIAIQDFTSKLHEHKCIPDDVDTKTMMHLFEGKPCRTKIKWLVHPHMLTQVINGITEGEKPAVITWPEGTGKWEVVKQRFVNKEGKLLPENIRTEKPRVKTEQAVREIVESLTCYIHK